MQRPLLWKIALIGVVALLLQIPAEMIRGLVAERKQARDGVIAQIARGSSEAQRIVGPVLYVPWTRRSADGRIPAPPAGFFRMQEPGSPGKDLPPNGAPRISPPISRNCTGAAYSRTSATRSTSTA